MDGVVLLVEDNYDDALLAMRALAKSGLANEIVHLSGALEALVYLNNPKHALPSLILLDLKMPKMDGLELLQMIRHDPDKKSIPIVVLTSSEEETDMVKSKELGVKAYIIKPVDNPQFMEAISHLGLSWLILSGKS